MGMFDTIVVIDDEPAIACPHGHRIRDLQTKDFDARMATYLLVGGELKEARPIDHSETTRWTIQGDRAKLEYDHTLVPTYIRSFEAYGTCDECEPVLVRQDKNMGFFGDIASEHKIFVSMNIEIRDRTIQIKHNEGDRDAMKRDLTSRGLIVLADDEPLAIAHRELKKRRLGR